MIIKAIVLVTLLAAALAVEKAKVYEITSANLDKFLKDPSYWLIQVSQGKCPQCQKHEAELQQIAHVIYGAVKVGKIQARQYPSIKITRNPTYIFTRSDNAKKFYTFEGQFNKEVAAKFCLEQLSVQFMIRQMQRDMNNEKPQENKEKTNQKSNQKPTSQESGQKPSATVIELNDKVFEEKVLKSSDAWLVQFYSPGCGHCKSFEPQYNKLPKLIGKRVHISRIDGSKNQQFMGKYKVKGFPTVLLFDTENKKQPVTYEGQRTADAVAQWLTTQHINEEKREILELTEANYIQECNKNIICLVFILDNKSDKSRLGFLAETMVEQATKPLRFFYSERLEQFQYDLMISDRQNPKLVCIWNYLNSYRIYNGEMNHEGLSNYLKTIFERKSWIKYQTKMQPALFNEKPKGQL